MITTLIDKQDNFEVVRDQVAAILKLEVTNQMALATAASKDPALWNMEIYSERSNPWEKWLNNNGNSNKIPIVNVWYDNSNFDEKSSGVVERQKSESVINIDCYGYGLAADIPAGGHTPGDLDAALEAQRALRLVRNIMMASEYTYLGLGGLVWRRWPQSMTPFQPTLDSRPIQQIVAARLALRVDFNEFSPQYEAETLELLSVQVKRSETGEIYINADYE